MSEQNQIIIFKTEDDKISVDVQFIGETAWLSLDQMAVLFERDKSTISRHIKNIYEEGELAQSATVAKFATVQSEGLRQVERQIEFYNLDVIISVGYRVKSKRGTQFRIWATQRLHEYIQKGFTMDDERLKGTGGGNYWRELLNRIRDIRSSEKVIYRQVLDLYATSRDYNATAPETIAFFKVVQNKLHFAAHGHTAAEVIHQRVDAEKAFLGLTTFKGALPTKSEAKTAKNYLSEGELKILNNLVSGYFDFAEIYATRHEHLYMADHLKHLDSILSATGEKVLKTAGKISHDDAMAKVDAEYKKYQQLTLTPVEESYLASIHAIEHKLNKKGENHDQA